MKTYELKEAIDEAMDIDPDAPVIVYTPDTKTLADVESWHFNGPCLQLNLEHLFCSQCKQSMIPHGLDDMLTTYRSLSDAQRGAITAILNDEDNATITEVLDGRDYDPESESPVTSIDQQYPNNLTDPDARAYLENIIGGVHENNAFNGGTWSAWENAQHIVSTYEPEATDDGTRELPWEHFGKLELADQTEILRVLNLAIENKGPTQ